MTGATTDAVVTEAQGPVLLIGLNRPAKRNAINTDVVNGLRAAFDRLDTDASLAAGVVFGAGESFCSGMDLEAFAAEGLPVGFERVFRDGTTKPLVAAIEGFALAGGLELALTCDLLVAAKDAKLGLPEVRVGLFAAGGGLLRLGRSIPYAAAVEMTLTGMPIDAERALALGLVSRLSERGQALGVAVDLARRISVNAPVAVAVSKQLLRAAQGTSEEELWTLQAPLIRKVFASADAQEGTRAFIEKRDPVWGGS